MTEPTDNRVILEMRGITKRFPGVLALNNVDFTARRGEIHSVIGQNGAGKSTLVKILAGDYSPTQGEIFMDGQAVTFHNQRESRAKGISIVYQELSLLPNLTVADNIFLGREPGRRFMINESEIHTQARQVLAQSENDNPRRIGEADFFSRYALKWSSNDPEVQRIRNEITRQIGKSPNP